MTNPLFLSGEKLAAKYAAGSGSIDDIKKELAKTASQEKWNAHQIERVVEKANRNILVAIQKDTSRNGGDPHFTFDTIKTAEIIGMLDSSAKPTKPSLPEGQKKEFNWGVEANPKFKDRSKETNLEDYIKPDAEIPSKDVGVLALQLMKDRVGQQKSDLAKTEIALEGAIGAFGKEAEQMLMSGTPVEVLLSLPSKDIVEKSIEKVAGYGTKMKKLAHHVEFEIDKNHKMYKMASQIQSLREQKFETMANLESWNKRLKDLSNKVRAMK
jgi:hypothetical protein